jgi:hypothetical protein
MTHSCDEVEAHEFHDGMVSLWMCLGPLHSLATKIELGRSKEAEGGS